MDKRLLDKTILIIIPSYEDPSLISTMWTAIDNAVNPDRVFFAVGLQHKRISLDLSPFKNLQVIEYDVDNRPGLIQVRNDLASMIGDKDFFLSIDSHMTFTKDWDLNILTDYYNLVEEVGDYRVVFSCQMPPLQQVNAEPCHCTSSDNEDYHSFSRFDSSNPIDGEFTSMFSAQPERYKSKHKDFIKVLYVSMDLFFAPREYLENKKFFIDKLKMFNDEPLASYLLFMRGWSAYKSYKNVYAYHNSNPFSFAITKDFSSTVDTIQDLHDATMLMLYNSGPFSVDSEKRPEEFYLAAGLEDYYQAVLANEKYYNTYCDILE